MRFRPLSISHLSRLILFCGAASTLGGAFWQYIFCRYRQVVAPLSGLSCLTGGIRELLLSAVLHLLLFLAVAAGEAEEG